MCWSNNIFYVHETKFWDQWVFFLKMLLSHQGLSGNGQWQQGIFESTGKKAWSPALFFLWVIQLHYSKYQLWKWLAIYVLISINNIILLICKPNWLKVWFDMKNVVFLYMRNFVSKCLKASLQVVWINFFVSVVLDLKGDFIIQIVWFCPFMKVSCWIQVFPNNCNCLLVG